MAFAMINNTPMMKLSHIFQVSENGEVVINPCHMGRV